MKVLAPTELTAIPLHTEFLAGGTDLGERLRNGSLPGAVADISALPGLREIDIAASSTAVGALVTIEQVGAHPEIRHRHPALAAVCRTLATPQIRTQATMGGIMCQRTRCWYFRHHAFSCFKSGGDGCPARQGNNLYGVAIDLGPCVYPHPSSVGVALLAYGGTIDTDRRDGVTPETFFGDGSDPTRDHHLEPGELLTRVRIPYPGEDEDSAYVRLMSRTWAEWPLVECVVRLQVRNGRIRLARVAVGGVANIPLRLSAVEKHLEGSPASAETFEAASRLADQQATVLPGAQDKRAMIRGTVLETLETARK
jgi:xanthine dehydrogenase YagS FAD-binding subunit